MLLLPVIDGDARKAALADALSQAARRASSVPRKEKRVVALIPAEGHARPTGEIIKTPLIVQCQGLLDAQAKVGKFLQAE